MVQYTLFKWHGKFVMEQFTYAALTPPDFLRFASFENAEKHFFYVLKLINNVFKRFTITPLRPPKYLR